MKIEMDAITKLGLLAGILDIGAAPEQMQVGRDTFRIWAKIIRDAVRELKPPGELQPQADAELETIINAFEYASKHEETVFSKSSVQTVLAYLRRVAEMGKPSQLPPAPFLPSTPCGCGVCQAKREWAARQGFMP